MRVEIKIYPKDDMDRVQQHNTIINIKLLSKSNTSMNNSKESQSQMNKVGWIRTVINDYAIDSRKYKLKVEMNWETETEKEREPGFTLLLNFPNLFILL